MIRNEFFDLSHHHKKMAVSRIDDQRGFDFSDGVPDRFGVGQVHAMPNVKSLRPYYPVGIVRIAEDCPQHLFRYVGRQIVTDYRQGSV